MAVFRAAPASPAADADLRTGLAAALAAFLIWGVAPLYFAAVSFAGPLEILSHRICWTVLLMVALVMVTRRGRELRAVLAAPTRWPVYLATTLLVSGNWGLFIYSIQSGQLMQASLGYYINPLVYVLLGVVFLGERLNRGQGAAVGLAAMAVLTLTIWAGVVPWIALTLAISFGLYGLLRKRAGIDPVVGLLVETLLVAPIALGFLVLLGAEGHVDDGFGPAVLLMLSGVVTGAPLVLFMMGAARLRLSTIGLMQYIAPSLQFVIAIWVFGEPFSLAWGAAFALIWGALAIYTAATLRPPATADCPSEGSGTDRG